MTYFLAPGELSEGATVRLEGEEARHLLQSRRMRAGERFALQDPRGLRFWAEVVQAERGSAQVRVHGPAPIPALPERVVRLGLASIKDKALEWLVQKATELGVAELHVFTAQQSTLPHAELAAPRTQERWARIAVEACKQCDRQFPPALRVWASLDALLASGTHSGAGWLLDREGEPPLRALPPRETALTMLCGPEGGLTAEEGQAARVAGFVPVSLGPLTLRAETAALAGCALATQSYPEKI